MPKDKLRRINGRPVAGAKLKIGDKELTKKMAPTDLCAAFTVDLKKGDRPRLQSWFNNAGGKNLGGTYFVYVTKK